MGMLRMETIELLSKSNVNRDQKQDIEKERDAKIVPTACVFHGGEPAAEVATSLEGSRIDNQ